MIHFLGNIDMESSHSNEYEPLERKHNNFLTSIDFYFNFDYIIASHTHTFYAVNQQLFFEWFWVSRLILLSSVIKWFQMTSLISKKKCSSPIETSCHKRSPKYDRIEITFVTSTEMLISPRKCFLNYVQILKGYIIK